MSQPSPIPAVKYIRYSSEMQRDGYSVEYQDRALDNWAAQHGRVFVGRYVDEAKSGTSQQREDFQRLLADCRSDTRNFVEVAVFHTWRFSRSMDDAPLFSELESLGITVQSATEAVTTNTASGKFQRNITLAVGAYQVDQLREATSAGKQQRVRGKAGQGGRSNSNAPPFGYWRLNGQDVPDMRVINPDEVEPRTNWDGAQVFKRMALEGAGDGVIAAELNRQGYRTVGMWGARPFSRDTITGMARNAFYAGKISYRGMSVAKDANGKRKRNPKTAVQWFEGEHTPLFTADEWAQYQAIRASRTRSNGGYPPKRVYLLERRVCSACGQSMRGKWLTGKKVLSYSCTSHERGLECSASQSPVREHFILPQIEALIEALDMPESVAVRAVAMVETGVTRDTIIERRDELQAERRRVAVMFQKGYIPETQLDAEIARIDGELARLVLPDGPTVMHYRLNLIRIVYMWKLATLEQKRAMLSELLEVTVIDTTAKRAVCFVPAVAFMALFDVAPGLERVGRGYLAKQKTDPD